MAVFAVESMSQPMPSSSIHWRDLAVSARGKQLVHAHSGTARAGRLLAVMGPSGAGKSVLLHALAGLTPAMMQVRGEIWDDSGSARVGVPEGTMALLEQEVPFFSELTVRETVIFAAELEGMPRKAAVDSASALLRQVGLENVADQKVGERYVGSSGHGVSGGERRRLAVACALVGEGSALHNKRPAKALLADEPTTGLDTFQAAEMVQLLRELSITRCCATVMTIHQPRSSVWKLIDDVMLVGPGGIVVYCGSTDGLLPHLSALGHVCPREGVNPAEFVIDVLSVHTGNSAAASVDHDRIASLAAAYTAGVSISGPPLYSGCAHQNHGSDATPTCKAFWLLLRRAWKQVSRDRITNLSRFGSTVGLGFLFGAQFGRFEDGEVISVAEVSSRVGLLSFGGISMAFIGAMAALDRFAKEKRMVGRERAARRYSGLVYLAAKVVAELPSDAFFAGFFGLVVHAQCGLRMPAAQLAGICALVALTCAALGLAIGAAVPTAERAMIAGVPVMTLHMLTGVIDPAGATAKDPSQTMLILRSISPIRHVIEALCHAEFDGVQIGAKPSEAAKIGSLALARTGEAVLQGLGITKSYEDVVIRLIVLFFIHLILAAVIIVMMQPSFSRAGIISKTRAVVVPVSAVRV